MWCQIILHDEHDEYATQQAAEVRVTYLIRIQRSGVQCSTVQYSTVQYSTVQYSTVQYSTVQCSAVQYSIVQYSAEQLTPPDVITTLHVFNAATIASSRLCAVSHTIPAHTHTHAELESDRDYNFFKEFSSKTL